ncbi:hypothetical protein B0H19DRAFT_1251189 [Mycena capillaripes]|nr:hypothetical protein B0H19DRAFT_1251189 [Mycena capillaripes]
MARAIRAAHGRDVDVPRQPLSEWSNAKLAFAGGHTHASAGIPTAFHGSLDPYGLLSVGAGARALRGTCLGSLVASSSARFSAANSPTPVDALLAADWGASVSLSGALQEYLDDPAIEQNRIEYRMNKETVKRGRGAEAATPGTYELHLSIVQTSRVVVERAECM